jgi:Glycolipid 2-alpha-mannosyltransferase
VLTGGLKKVWSNFEIADMDFWRGEAYTAFFNYLDSLGGFYYEVRHMLTLFAAAHILISA